MNKKIYFDNAATTACSLTVLTAMKPYFRRGFGNGLSQHAYGREAEAAISKARTQVADSIGAEPSEIYFTGSGTEANNWAIKGIVESLRGKGRHIVSTQIEHPSVLNTLEYLQKAGLAEVTYVKPDQNGFITSKSVADAVREDTILITVMAANNEIGTVQPVSEIAEIAKERNIYFHTDAVQAAGLLHLNVKSWGCDLMTLSAHKFHGPKGVGVLYKRNGVRLPKFIHGGEQERGLRGGTHNTAGIVGMGFALARATSFRGRNGMKIQGLRNYFEKLIRNRIPDITINGSAVKRLPGISSVTFDYIEGESILLRLDLEGIAVSSGSACSSGSLEPSHVLLACGVPLEKVHGTIRFSFGRRNKLAEVDYAVEKLEKVVNELRAISPLFAQHKGRSDNV